MCDCKNDGLVALTREVVIAQMDKAIHNWGPGGGLERSNVALEVEYKDRLLSLAPKTKGFLWWKRETTPTERKVWMESVWADDSWQSEGWPLKIGMSMRQSDRKAAMKRLAVLHNSAHVSPAGTVLYVPAEDWNFAHKMF